MSGQIQHFAVKHCTFVGRPPEGRWYIHADEERVLFFDRLADDLPPCGKCGALPVDHGELIGKYLDATRWDNPRIWCMEHVPWRLRVRDRVNAWRFRIRRSRGRRCETAWITWTTSSSPLGRPTTTQTTTPISTRCTD